jgi:hypothetical protein
MSFVREASAHEVNPSNPQILRVAGGPYSLSHVSDKEGVSTQQSSIIQRRNQQQILRQEEAQLSQSPALSYGTDPVTITKS